MMFVEHGTKCLTWAMLKSLFLSSSFRLFSLTIRKLFLSHGCNTPSKHITHIWLEILLRLAAAWRFQSYNGEISVGSYGFTLGKYTEQAAELLDTKDWVVKIQEKERVAAFAGEINKSLEKVQHPYKRLCLFWVGWTGQSFAQANVDKQDLQPSAPQSQLWVRNFIMRLFDSPFFIHLYPKSW